MMFSTRAEYGVRVMIALGRRAGDGPVPLAEIAEQENLPLAYLEQLAARLRKHDLITSTRGAHGGYQLGRAPDQITMAEVVFALEGTLMPMQCFSEPSSGKVLCNHEIDGFENCATRLLWTRVQGGVARALEQTTVAELAEFAEHGAKPAASKSRTRSKASSGASSTVRA
jgi:Rrf2 family cysteine metabolism transcriptional repressor